ncbi:MAG: SPOR domain-containing protein [Thiomicrorhabdus sp.]|nr:SPOR domain-containing protein [Thiomicrorhabdus sp.]
MARDYRHGHAHRRSFQRKSQQEGARSTEKRSSFLIWGVALLLSVAFVAIFFVVKHFVFQGGKLSELETQTIFKAVEVHEKELAVEDVEPESKERSTPTEPLVSEVVLPTEKEGKNEKERAPDNVDSNFYSFYQGLGQTKVVVEAELISVALEQPYYIQAGSFGSKSVAMEEVNRLKKHGQKLEVSALTKGDRTYYRLRMGPFTDRLLMNKRRNELRKLGVDTLLIKSSK